MFVMAGLGGKRYVTIPAPESQATFQCAGGSNCNAASPDGLASLQKNAELAKYLAPGKLKLLDITY